MRKGFIAYHNILQKTRKLSDAEMGRLFRALLTYSETGIQPENLQGREEPMFDALAYDIDQERIAYEATCRRNRANRNGSSPLVTTRHDPSPLTTTDDETGERKRKGKRKEDIDDDDTARARDPIFGYAMDALSFLSPTAMQELASYRADIGDELTRYAIDEAVDHGGRTWAYTRTILENIIKNGYKTVGEAKAAKEKRAAKPSQSGNTGKVNPAQQYDQRDYSTKADEFKPMSLEELFEGGTR